MPARVTGSRGEELHLTEEGVEAREFRFEATEGGRYTTFPMFDQL